MRFLLFALQKRIFLTIFADKMVINCTKIMMTWLQLSKLFINNLQTSFENHLTRNIFHFWRYLLNEFTFPFLKSDQGKVFCDLNCPKFKFVYKHLARFYHDKINMGMNQVETRLIWEKIWWLLFNCTPSYKTLENNKDLPCKQKRIYHSDSIISITVSLVTAVAFSTTAPPPGEHIHFPPLM